MGIPGLLKEIGKGERVALAKLAIEHFEKHQRPLRIAIDAAIWNFQTQSGQGGKNPALRTLFYRLLRLLALPIQPVFVYDGKNKPLMKRGKTVNRYGTCLSNELSKNLVARFQFPHHTAPGEAEAECALLQKSGIVDAVMSQDVDAIMFGSTLTFRDWSKEGTKGNKAPTHVSVLEHCRMKEVSGLDAAGMILVALLSGGDYHEGVQGFGPGLSCQIARAGFGDELLIAVQSGGEDDLREWRDRLQYELETNESGYFLKRHRTVKVPADFPDRTILGYYTNPAVSTHQDLLKLKSRWVHWWDREIDVIALREYVAMTFDWLYKGGARKYIRCLAQPLFQHYLRRRTASTNNFTLQDITEQRKHFVTGGISEMRLSVIPAAIVNIDLDAEEDNPEYAELEEDDEANDLDTIARQPGVDNAEEPTSPSKRRKRPPWDPSTIEKWWIPETLLYTGMPGVLKAWHQEQHDIRADPVRFATRKCKPPAKTKAAMKIDQNMKDGAIERLLFSVNVQSTDVRPARKQPLQRARTDTAILQNARESNINKFFRPSKLAKAPTYLPENSKTALSKNETCIELDSDSDFDVDLLDLLHKPTKPKKPWLACPEAENTMTDPAKSLTVIQRGKRGRTPQPCIDEEEIVCVGSQSLPPRVSIISESKEQIDSRTSEAKHITSASPALPRVLRPQLDQAVTVTAGTTIGQATSSETPMSNIGGPPPVVPKTTHQRVINKVAVVRESLPGTWKEMPLTPSHSAGVAFIDLTNT